jgi:D-alanine-D-alanine ligase
MIESNMKQGKGDGMAKIRVGILYGGKSAEHEVSLQSARNICDALDREKYEPVLLGIDKTGRWHYTPSAAILSSPGAALPEIGPDSKTVVFAPQGGGLAPEAEGAQADVIFPILHGPFGEDGTVQGLLRLADLPFVGSGVLGSAVGMDKDVMKRLLRDAGLPIGRFRALAAHEPIPDFGEVTGELGLPLFVKPANMGSSVGVNKIHDEAEYNAFVREAFEYDRKIILEEFIKGREIECAVLGNEEPAASPPGEVITRHEFYSYDAKYLDENGAALEIPAKLPPALAGKIQALAIKTFRVLGCEGLGRVDFFLRGQEEVLVNEINTMPGFTRISMYPKLWEAAGLSYGKLIDTLIDLAFERRRREAKVRTSYR